MVLQSLEFWFHRTNSSLHIVLTSVVKFRRMDKIALLKEMIDGNQKIEENKLELWFKLFNEQIKFMREKD